METVLSRRRQRFYDQQLRQGRILPSLSFVHTLVTRSVLFYHQLPALV